MKLALFAALLCLTKNLGVVISIPLKAGLSDPSKQPIFQELAPNALLSQYKAAPVFPTITDYNIQVGKSTGHYTGLLYHGLKVNTTIFGYGQKSKYTWPGPTSHVWNNKLESWGAQLC